MIERSRLDAMSKPWKCWVGWHAWVRQPGHDDPNHQICLRCQKKRNSAWALGPMGGGEGGSGFG
jgi:hypothetical protein